MTKRLFTASAILIRQLAEITEDTIVIVQMKKRQTPAGIRSYFEVTKIVAASPEEQPKEIETIQKEEEPALDSDESF